MPFPPIGTHSNYVFETFDFILFQDECIERNKQSYLFLEPDNNWLFKNKKIDTFFFRCILHIGLFSLLYFISSGGFREVGEPGYLSQKSRLGWRQITK